MCWVLQMQKVNKVTSLYPAALFFFLHRKTVTLKFGTHVKCTVKDWSCVLVLHPHGVCHDIIETNRAVPGGNQQELGCAGAEFDSRNAVLWSLVQLVLI